MLREIEISDIDRTLLEIMYKKDIDWDEAWLETFNQLSSRFPITDVLLTEKITSIKNVYQLLNDAEIDVLNFLGGKRDIETDLVNSYALKVFITAGIKWIDALYSELLVFGPDPIDPTFMNAVAFELKRIQQIPLNLFGHSYNIDTPLKSPPGTLIKNPTTNDFIAVELRNLAHYTRFSLELMGTGFIQTIPAMTDLFTNNKYAENFFSYNLAILYSNELMNKLYASALLIENNQKDLIMPEAKLVILSFIKADIDWYETWFKFAPNNLPNLKYNNEIGNYNNLMDRFILALKEFDF